MTKNKLSSEADSSPKIPKKLITSVIVGLGGIANVHSSNLVVK
jgi:hypothetical protein